MDWIRLESETDLEKVISDSFTDGGLGVAVFKHSTRCSISSVAKNRLSSKWDFEKELPIYYLDLIKHRNISDAVTEMFSIEHESPQFLLIKNGTCIYNSSHSAISVKEIKEFLKL